MQKASTKISLLIIHHKILFVYWNVIILFDLLNSYGKRIFDFLSNNLVY